MPNIGDIIRADDINDIKSGGYIGQIIAFTSNLIPSNVLICDGAEISRESYSELFTVINTIYGEGDGSTTFNLPDLRDRWIKYSGTENNVGEKIAEGLPNITGDFDLWGWSVSGCFYVKTQFEHIDVENGGYYDCLRGELGFDASRSSAIYGTSDHVTPNSIALLPCIIYE